MERPRDSKPDVKAIASGLGAVRDAAGLARALSGLDPEKLTVNDYSLLSRALQAAAAPDVKIAYLGNFTLDLLPRCVDVRAAREGLRAAAHVGKFGQYVQEVLDDGSALADTSRTSCSSPCRCAASGPTAVTAFARPIPGRAPRAERRGRRPSRVLGRRRARAASATLLVANFPVLGPAGLAASPTSTRSTARPNFTST